MVPANQGNKLLLQWGHASPPPSCFLVVRPSSQSEPASCLHTCGIGCWERGLTNCHCGRSVDHRVYFWRLWFPRIGPNFRILAHAKIDTSSPVSAVPPWPWPATPWAENTSRPPRIKRYKAPTRYLGRLVAVVTNKGGTTVPKDAVTSQGCDIAIQEWTVKRSHVSPFQFNSVDPLNPVDPLTRWWVESWINPSGPMVVLPCHSPSKQPHYLGSQEIDTNMFTRFEVTADSCSSIVFFLVLVFQRLSFFTQKRHDF